MCPDWESNWQDPLVCRLTLNPLSYTSQGYFPMSLLKFSLSSPTLHLIEHPYNSVLNFAPGTLPVSILFSSFFLEFCSVLSFGACFFVSPFWLPLCFCFSIGELLGLLVLVEWTYVGGVYMAQQCSFPIHLSWALQERLFLCLPIPWLCTSSCCSWALFAAISVNGRDYSHADRIEDLLCSQQRIWCTGLT